MGKKNKTVGHLPLTQMDLPAFNKADQQIPAPSASLDRSH